MRNSSPRAGSTSFDEISRMYPREAGYCLISIFIALQYELRGFRLRGIDSVTLRPACAQLFSAQAGHASKRYSPILVVFDVFKEIAGHSYLSLDMSRFRTLQ
jgi:hypothetical protein